MPSPYEQLQARVDILERITDHLPNPDAKLPGDLDGVGSFFFIVLLGGVVIGAGYYGWQAATAFIAKRK